MRERIARAIVKAGMSPGLWQPHEIEEVLNRPRTISQMEAADAVLAAMREPTPEMIQSRIDRYPTELRIRDSDLETWRDMIDAARAPSS